MPFWTVNVTSTQEYLKPALGMGSCICFMPAYIQHLYREDNTIMELYISVAKSFLHTKQFIAMILFLQVNSKDRVLQMAKIVALTQTWPRLAWDFHFFVRLFIGFLSSVKWLLNKEAHR